MWTNSACWSLGHVPTEGEDVVIAAGRTTLTASAPKFSSLTVGSGATLVFDGWETAVTADLVRINGTATHSTNMAVSTNALGEWPRDNRVWIVATNVQVFGAINADFRGWRGRDSGGPYGPGRPAFDRGGGAYGGRGGTYSAGTLAGTTYGSESVPEDPGSGGGYSYGGGGAGGGAVRIDATGHVLVNGLISANGEYLTAGWDRGGGSGGSIFITCATFAGTGGVIRAEGGCASHGPGGGGRIAIVCSDPAAQAVLPRPFVALSVARGPAGGGCNQQAEHGTLYLNTPLLLPEPVMSNCQGRLRGLPGWSLSFNELFLTNSFLQFPSNVEQTAISVSNSLVMSASTLDVEGYALSRTPMWLEVGGDMVLTNGSRIYIFAGPTNPPATTNCGALISVNGALVLATNCAIYPAANNTNGGAVLIRTSNLVLQAGSSINADSRGWTTGWGPGRGTGRGGAGHGGKGGWAYEWGEPGGQAYGSEQSPIEPGSGSNHRSGGGTIWVQAAGTVNINGTITAQGQGGAHDNGAAAGGSVYITCDTISGGCSGRINADGGSTSGTSGGGGGGRVAVYYRSDHWGTNAVSASGGINSSSGNRNGTNGTVVWVCTATNADDRVLTVRGEPGPHGQPSPHDYGANAVKAGSALTETVASPADESSGTAYACIGWTLSNGTSLINTGTSNTAHFAMDSDLYLTWHWTSLYYLACSANVNGSLAADRSGWYTNMALVSLQAVPDAGYSFLQWSGAGVPAGMHTNNPLNLVMDRPRDVMANFASLTATQKTWTGVAEWFSAANWIPPGPPGMQDAVVIPSGTNTLRDPVTVKSVLVCTAGVLRVEQGSSLATAGSVTITGLSAVVHVTNATLRCGGDLRILAGGSLYTWGGAAAHISNATVDVSAGGEIRLTSNSVIYAASHPTNGGSSILRARDVTIEAGAMINAEGRGYGVTYGPGVGTGRGGGGYGGAGGMAYGFPELGGPSYGWSNAPVHPGSGSGNAGYGGRAGGGVIRIEASGIVTLNGSLNANGLNGQHDIGSGAGGSIFITCRRMSGSGQMTARGGDTSGTSGGGGGGRVAVWSTTLDFPTNNATARGGIHATDSARNGGDGTIVWGHIPAPGTVFVVR